MMFAGVIANGPDRELHFARTVRSQYSPSVLGRSISDLRYWPQWFFSLDQAVVSEGQTEPGPLHAGENLTLRMDPKKGESKRFLLGVKVLEYVPDRLIHLQIIRDTKNRLTRLFDRLEWSVEIIPEGPEAPGGPNETGTLIRGTATAHTSHWRSRLFGQLAGDILMNQVFYPDLIRLGETADPTAHPSPGLDPNAF